MAGMAATPGPLLATLFAIMVSKKQGQWGQQRLLTMGGVLFVLSNLWLARRINPVPNYIGTWLPSQIISGIAIGLMLPSLAGAAVQNLRTDRLGVRNAVNNTIRQLGSSLGVALAVALAGKCPKQRGTLSTGLSLSRWNRRADRCFGPANQRR
jgi:hypothetical protein